MSHHIKTFEQLREHIWQERQDCIEILIDRLGEIEEFDIGRWRGEIDAYGNMLDTLRNILKYGEELDELDEKSD